MSLLIPSACDYEDAHADPGLEARYQALLDQAKVQEPDLFKWTFEVVPGFFKQADPELDDLKFNYVFDQLGRLKPWAEIESLLQALNEQAPPNVAYKLIFCARHGQGYHNHIVDKYGHAAWDAKWFQLTTDGEVEYAPDPMLTATGLEQAGENHAVWQQELEAHGAPVPAEFYVSPLQRLCWTLAETWKGLLPEDRHPLVVERLRETIGRNLCDKRSLRLTILERFGGLGFEVEPGFAEEDPLFGPDRESAEAQAVRVNRWCQDLFEGMCQDGQVVKSTAAATLVISTTTHAGTIRSFIVVFGHRRFTISTGGMIPIVVKATRQSL